MITVSTALPFHFWPIGSNTFNESRFGFVFSRPYFHEWLSTDNIKLQLTDTDNKRYGLEIVDLMDNKILTLDYTKTVIAGLNVYDLEFQFATLAEPIIDQRVRCYIVQRGSLDPGTLDGGSLDTDDTRLYKTDYMDSSSSINYDQGWATETINYKSLSNYYQIQYPNNGNYFNLRIPCKLYSEREQETVNEIQLSDIVLATSRTKKPQIYLEPYQLPAYMMKKISAALSHDVTGSVQINGVEYEAEAFEWSQTDSKAPFFKGKVWLTDKNNFIRNII